MNAHEVRRAIALYRGPIKPLLLSEQQREVLQCVMRQEEASANFIAYRFGISVPHASTVLSTLYKKGYLDRAEIPQESGGYEYEYISTVR